MGSIGRRVKKVQDPDKPRAPRRVFGVEEAKAAATMTSAEWKKLQVGMKEKFPAPEYMKKPHDGGHTSYRDETYEAITRWTAETKIEYRPHAKAPGSKSHLRYETYSSAKTVGDALKVGSWPADWCWDYERGFIKVLGPVRDEPLDCSKITNGMEITDVDKCIWRWYLRELASKFGLTVEDLEGQCSGETLIMRAHRLVADRQARKHMEAAEKEKRKIRDEEIYDVLNKWAFARNTNRVNVTPDDQDWVWSDTLGLLRTRTGEIHLTPSTKTYPVVVAMLNKYLRDRLPPNMKDFKWTSLNLNCNYAAKLHRDGNNFGPSCIKAFGPFTGGELNYYPEDNRRFDKLDKLRDEDKVSLDISKGLALFNGNCAHDVNDFEKDRYSVVYFTVRCFKEAPQGCKEDLRTMGMEYPGDDHGNCRYSLLRPPTGYSKPDKADELPTEERDADKNNMAYGYWKNKDIEGTKCPAAFPLLNVYDVVKGVVSDAKLKKDRPSESKKGAVVVGNRRAAKALQASKDRKEGKETESKDAKATKAAAKGKAKAKGKAQAKSKVKATDAKKGGSAPASKEKSTPVRKDKKLKEEPTPTPAKGKAAAKKGAKKA